MGPPPHHYVTQSQAQSRPRTFAALPAWMWPSLDGRHRLQQNPRTILFGAILGSAEHRLHLFVVDLVVDDEVGLLAKPSIVLEKRRFARRRRGGATELDPQGPGPDQAARPGRGLRICPGAGQEA